MNPQLLCTGGLVNASLRGYRTFRLNAAGQLRSTGVDHVWSGLPQHARCLSTRACWCGLCHCDEPTHDAPHAACSCGLYGWYTPDDTRIVPAQVFGVVAAHGRVLLGTHGFRAEHAKLLAYTTTSRMDSDVVDDLAGQGAVRYATRQDLLADFPPEDMSGLVQHACPPGGCTSPDRPYASQSLLGSLPSSFITADQVQRLLDAMVRDLRGQATPPATVSLVRKAKAAPPRANADDRPDPVKRVQALKAAGNGPAPRKPWWRP